MRSPFGFVIIDKPRGLTSHDCVIRVRRFFGIKRVGHGGTLDPSVTGVLPIALGNATRLLPYLPGDKTYKGTIQLGKQTKTDDLQGEVTITNPWPELNKELIKQQLKKFHGVIEQKPPQFSSVHVNGERAYKRARRGELLDMPSKSITIHQLQLLNWSQELGQIEIEVHCSAGTYIRSLARDLGNQLGCGACLAQLRRTQALGFHISEAFPLPNQIEGKEGILPVIYPSKALGHLVQLELTKAEQELWRTGRLVNITASRCKPPENIDSLKQTKLEQYLLVIDSEGAIAGIATWHNTSNIKPKVVFNAKG